MLFNSLAFIIFFVIVFVLYWFVLNRNLKLQNAFLLLVSYVFYGWWDWRFLFLLIFSSASDFFFGKRIHKAQDNRARKKWLLASLCINLGLLGFFKYFNFFVNSLAALFSSIGISVSLPVLHIILPVGLSFYTFQSLTYTIDIYKRRMEPTNNMLNFFAFVAFFPQLVAGPIERAKHLLPQFFQARSFNYETAKSGGRLILIGFFKKIVIADGLSTLVNSVYNSPESYAGFPMLIATVFFAFQIYCDFSGYSDIAVGTARLLGFDLMSNFKTPYFSKSLTEFWHRWHISLSTWFRDYVYIPLGGSQGSKFRTNVNIFITFVLSGFWHGANITFIIWGAIHGCVLIVEKTLTKKKQENKNIIHRLLSVLLTFTIVCFAWIFFRSNSLRDAIFIISKMFSDIRDYTNFDLMSLKFRGMGLKTIDLLTPLFFVGVLIITEILYRKVKIRNTLLSMRIVRWSLYYFLLIAIVFSATKNPAGNFIYFQF